MSSVGYNSNWTTTGFRAAIPSTEATTVSHIAVFNALQYGRLSDARRAQRLSLHNNSGGPVRRLPKRLALYSLMIGLSACASSGGGSATARSSPDQITRAEIASSSATNAYELISRLRPNWLRTPATATVGGGVIRTQAILVYLDRQRLEDVNALRTISVTGIDSAQWIDAGRAPTVLPDVPTSPIAGAIVLRTH